MIEKSPESRSNFCETCGEATIDACPGCDEKIRGYYMCGVIGGGYDAPHFCHKCGKPFPWTDRATQAAITLFTEEIGQSNQAEIDQFKDTLDNLVKETPKTPLAASKFKKAMVRVGKTTGSLIEKTIISVLSEAAKNAMNGL